MLDNKLNGLQWLKEGNRTLRPFAEDNETQ